MYVKLFSDILLSSLWAEDSDVRIIWITLLLLADEDGMVRSSASGIAHAARVDVEITKHALVTLESPDPDSRTPDNEGKRIERVDGGYIILNYKAYRQLRNKAEQREATRLRVKRFRDRKGAARCNAPVIDVTLGNAIADTEADAEADTEADTTDKSSASQTTPPFSEIQNQWNEQAKQNGLPECRDLTEKRKTGIRQRWRNEYWRESWKLAICKVKDSPFLRGENDQGWRANIDWFLRPDTVNKIMEGTYAAIPKAKSAKDRELDAALDQAFSGKEKK